MKRHGGSRESHMKIRLEDAVKKIREKGSGIHKIRNKYFAFGESWDYECVNDICGHLEDNEEFDACAREHAHNTTHEDIPKELNKKGFDVLSIDLVNDFDDVPYGYSIALLKKR